MLKDIATQPDLFATQPDLFATQPDLGSRAADRYPLPAASVAPNAPAPPTGSTPRPVVASSADDPTGDTLSTEIATLHDLLAAVSGTADLDLAQRITAYCKGADTLARLLRAQHGLAPTDPATDLTALLDRLDTSSEF